MRASLLLLVVAALGCARRSGSPPPAASTSAPSAEESEGPLRVELLDRASPPVFVLRGSRLGPEKLVFLHGMCGHGLGYAQSFQEAAAKRGRLVVPQADVSCGDSGARWSKDLASLDARLEAAFRALGHQEPLTDVIVIGYSQGATRAESLVREFPTRYTRLVLIGGPYVANPRGLETLRAAVAMAGDKDRLDLMQSSATLLKAAKVPAMFMLIPDATHGSMGSDPEKTMTAVFEWLEANQRP